MIGPMARAVVIDRFRGVAVGCGRLGGDALPVTLATAP